MDEPLDEATQSISEKTLDKQGKSVLRNYSKGFLLGKGAFAKVYKLTCDETNQVFAAKIIQKLSLMKSRTRQKLMSEIKIHKILKHQNVVDFKSYFEDEENLYILMEYCKNQTLSDMLRRRKRITQIEAQCYLKQILMGVKYMHAHRVIHRDLKLANIFLTENMEVKIGDFGLAAKLEFEGERKRTICGTPNYMAPEILDGKFGHSYECDIWSIGVILYTLLVGKPPFETGDVKKTYFRIKSGNYSFPEGVELSAEAKMLISSILVIDYQKRPTIDEIFESSFLATNSIPDLLPSCVLAIPPSQGYLRQFLEKGKGKNGSMVRSSTHENLSTNSASSPTSERPHSKEPKTPLYSETRGVIHYTSYTFPIHSGPEIWITKWVDYSIKYGVGYLLSNYWLGILFNDKSKILANSDSSKLLYFSSTQAKEGGLVCSISDFPKELYKKVMLIQVFRKMLQAEKSQELEGIHQGVHVKGLIKTPHGVVFRMSNKLIQFFFNDKSELIFLHDSKTIVYVDKKSHCQVMSISKAVEFGGKDLIKRLKYAKEILVARNKVNNE